MSLAALIILAVQTVLGALDNVLHHEITERLPSRPSARKELALHAGREAIYGVLFLVFAWTEPAGWFAAAVLTLILAEVAITIADFIEEDRTRHLPPFERVLHTVLAVLFGTFLAMICPWLLERALGQGTTALISHGLLSWFFTLSSIGVFAFSVRNAVAVYQLGKHTPPANRFVPASGRTVLITGATGFIGTVLVERLLARGDRVFVLARDARQARTLFGESVTPVETLTALPRETKIDAVINLAGSPIIGLPWTKGRRAAIWRSRVDLTSNLVAWMGTLDHPPAVLVNGSAIGFYGDRADDVLGEGERAGQGFAADLCRAWENEARRARDWRMRVVSLRIGLVLDGDGGALPMMALPVRLGGGAMLGSGNQWMSWITRSDLVRMIVAAMDDERWEGSVNAVAPEPLRHADFQRALARTLHRPMFLKIPAPILRLLLGEMSTIFLFSQRVVPAKAQALDFAFDVCWAADAFALQLTPQPKCLPSQAKQIAKSVPAE